MMINGGERKSKEEEKRGIRPSPSGGRDVRCIHLPVRAKLQFWAQRWDAALVGLGAHGTLPWIMGHNELASYQPERLHRAFISKRTWRCT